MHMHNKIFVCGCKATAAPHFCNSRRSLNFSLISSSAVSPRACPGRHPASRLPSLSVGSGQDGPPPSVRYAGEGPSDTRPNQIHTPVTMLMNTAPCPQQSPSVWAGSSPDLFPFPSLFCPLFSPDAGGSVIGRVLVVFGQQSFSR